MPSFRLYLFVVCPLFASLLIPQLLYAGPSLSPSSISFGSVTLGSATAPADITFSNNGHQSVTILQLTSSSSVFVVSSPALPLVLTSHSSATFGVSFAPTTMGTFTGTITFTTNSKSNSVLTVSVVGTAAPTHTYLLYPSTTSIVFGNILVGASSSQTLLLSNTGNSSVSISGVYLTGSSFSVSGFSGPVTLAAGQNLSLVVSCVPTYVGTYTGSINVTSNATNSPTTIALSGTGVQPAISVVPTSVSFPNVTVGVANSQTVTISNPGTADLTITQAALSGICFSYSGLALPMTIPPGGSSPFVVSFTPASTGTLSGTLTLANNSPTPSKSVALSGTGVPQTLQLSASPVSLSFGSVLTGSNATQTVTLTNTGSGSVSVSGDSVTGSGFTISGLSIPLTLSVGQSTSFNVAFAPTSAGSVTGKVTIISGATNSPATIVLSGTGLQPLISVTPTSLNFGGTVTGITNTQTLSVSNAGSANLAVTQASLSGAGFALSGLTLPLSVAPGGSSQFTVSFAPTTAGTFSGTLMLVNNSPTPSLGVAVTGTGVTQVLQLSASPASVSFGTVTTGTSATQTVTMTNTGNSAVSVSQITVSTNFSVSGITLPISLSAGQSTAFNVCFTPTTTGSLSGTVTVTSNASNSPTTVKLSGSGATSTVPSVNLTWTPSSSAYTGFDIYRGTTSGGPYTMINSSLTPSFTDTTVTSGQTYYYVVTEIDTSDNWSTYSNQATAVIP